MNKTIGIIGFGNQAKSWALNLRDSNFKTFIVLRQGSGSAKKAAKLGLEVLNLEDPLLKQVQLFALLIPDDQHLSALESLEQTNDSASIIYAHGYSQTTLSLNERFPQFEHLLLAPKAIGSEIRSQFETGGDLGAFYSVEFAKNKEESTSILKSVAKGIGITKGPFACRFDEETKADLFSEQSLLCSLIPGAAKKSFDLLIEQGIPAELAYFETWYEMKLIVDTLIKKGPEKFFQMISPNALIGAHYQVDNIIDNQFQTKLNNVISKINDGSFYKHVEETNFVETREELLKEWQDCLLTKTHNRLFGENSTEKTL